MKGFSSQISDADIADVTAFVFETFVQQKKINTYYHTAENGWPDHEGRYGVAYPFALREIAIDTPYDQLDEIQRAGLKLYMESCISCHDTGKVIDPGTAWDKYPLSSQGCGVQCHDGEVYFPGSLIPGQVGNTRSPYNIHQIKPEILDLSVLQREGESLFQDNCAFCHAPDGTGGNWIGTFLEPHARDLTDREATSHLDNKALLEVIRYGIDGSSMPAWRSVLDEQQIAAIAAYIERAFFKSAK